MGYDTSFSLVLYNAKTREIIPPDKWPDWSAGHEEHWIGDIYRERGDLFGRWYDYGKDMSELSLKYPEILFKLTGFGEGEGDIWRAFYYQGKEYHWELEIKWPTYEYFSALVAALPLKEPRDGC